MAAGPPCLRGVGTGTDWRTIQPWILCTNYQRYVDHFLVWALEELARPDGAYTALVLPGGAIVQRGDSPEAADAAIAVARPGIAARGV